MKAEFLQAVFNQFMLKRIQGGLLLWDISKEKLEEEDLKEALAKMMNDGILGALKETGQDPKEIMDMMVVAFENASKKTLELMRNHFTQLAEYIEKQKEVEVAE